MWPVQGARQHESECHIQIVPGWLTYVVKEWHQLTLHSPPILTSSHLAEAFIPRPAEVGCPGGAQATLDFFHPSPFLRFFPQLSALLIHVKHEVKSDSLTLSNQQAYTTVRIKAQ